MSFNRDDKKRYYGKKTDRGSFGAGRKPFRGDFDKKSTPYNDTDAAKEELSGWKSTGSNLDDNTFFNLFTAFMLLLAMSISSIYNNRYRTSSSSTSLT